MSYKRKNIKRISMVQPPCSNWPGEAKIVQPPLGIAYIAAVMEKEGYLVNIIDAALEGYEHEIKLADGRYRYGLTIGQILERIKSFSPEIVGISCSFSTLHDTVSELAKTVKRYNPDIIICTGGAHPTAVPDEMLSHKEIDFVVMGEGEIRFKRLVESLSTGGDLSQIDGLGYKLNGKPKINPPVNYIDNLDKIPFPARHLLDMEKYFHIHKPQGLSIKNKRGTTLITSRGCPANCVFCSIHGIWGKKFRAHSVDYVIREIEHLIKEYQIEELFFEDDNLTFDIKRAEKLFDTMIDRNYGLHWKTPNGIALWRLTKDLVVKMRQAGCYQTSFAIESGNEHVLHSIIKKPLNLEKVKSIVDTANSQGIFTEGFFVVGFPGETFQQMKDTFDYALEVGLDKPVFVIATPYPGTELYEICVREGFLAENYDYKNLITRKANIETKDFTPRQLERFVARSILKFQIKKFFKNPVVVLKLLYARLKSDPVATVNWILARFKEALTN